MAEWLRRGLQNLEPRFNSGRRLQQLKTSLALRIVCFVKTSTREVSRMQSLRPKKPFRLSSPLFQIFIASVLSFSSILLLWNSETRAIETSRALGDAPGQVVSLTNPVIEPVNEGRLIHTVGEVTTTLPLQDPDLDLMFEGTLVVERKVEMYQWIEVPNGPSFKYTLAWSSKWHDPDSFRVAKGHVNPPMQIATEKFVADDAKLGDFALTPETLAQLTPQEAFMPQDAPRGWIREASKLYLGFNPQQPALGDLRASYKLMRAPTLVTVIARQAPSTVTPYVVRNGTEILAIEQGRHTTRDLFWQADPFISMSLWIWRVTASLVLAISFYCIALQCRNLFHPKASVTKANNISLLRLSSIASMAFCISLISIAWLFRLPLASASALLVCGAVFFVALRYKDQLLSSSLLPNAVAQAMRA